MMSRPLTLGDGEGFREFISTIAPSFSFPGYRRLKQIELAVVDAVQEVVRV